MNTAEKVKLLRLQKGMTQEQLGNAIGVQKAAINKYEKGRVRNIKRSTLQKLADALGVAPVDLLDDEEAIIVNSKGDIIGVSEIVRSEQQKRLLYYFDMLDTAKAEMLLSLAEALADE